MRHAKRTLFLAALIMMVGVSAGVMAGNSSYTALSPNSGSLANIPTGNKKILTITGQFLENVTALQLKHTTGAAEVVAVNIVGVNAAGVNGSTELYATIDGAVLQKAGIYELDTTDGNIGPLADTTLRYELRRENNNLQVFVKMTLKARADITWAAGTGNTTADTGATPITDKFDDAAPGNDFTLDSITAFTWIVRDADLSGTFVAGGAGYNIDVYDTVATAPTYSSADAANGNKLLRIKNISKTNNQVDLYAQATDALPVLPANGSWTLVAAVGATANQFSLGANFLTFTNTQLSHVAPVVPNVNNLAINGTVDLELTVTPPSAIAAPVVAGTQYTSTVQITAVPQ